MRYGSRPAATLTLLSSTRTRPKANSHWPALATFYTLLIGVFATCVLGAPACARTQRAKAEDLELSLELVPVTKVPMAHTPVIAMTTIYNRSNIPVKLSLGTRRAPALQYLVCDAQGIRITPQTELWGFGEGLTDIVTIDPKSKWTTLALLDRWYHFSITGRYRVDACLLDWVSWTPREREEAEEWPVLAKDSRELIIESVSVDEAEKTCQFLMSRVCPGLREVAPPELRHSLWDERKMRRYLDNMAPRMLAYVTHEAALPYLAQAAANGFPGALEGLRRIGTPRALELLRSFAQSRDARLAIVAFQQLRLAQGEAIQLAPTPRAQD